MDWDASPTTSVPTHTKPTNDGWRLPLDTPRSCQVARVDRTKTPPRATLAPPAGETRAPVVRPPQSPNRYRHNRRWWSRRLHVSMTVSAASGGRMAGLAVR